jgi:DNA-binding transcriptional LysR family regulator
MVASGFAGVRGGSSIGDLKFAATDVQIGVANNGCRNLNGARSGRPTAERDQCGTMMDLDQLRTFVEVAKQGNFSKAATKVFRSQPAVSAQIRQLEGEYQQKLFDRSGKRVRLTPAGDLLLDYAKQMLRIHRDSINAVSDNGGLVRGVLSIGANEGTFLYVLPEVFKRFHKRYPEVRIDVYRNFSHKVLQKVEDGSVDIGVATLPVRNSSLKVIPMFREQLVLAVDARTPVRSRKEVTIAEVAALPLIFPRTGYTRRAMEKCLRPHQSSLRVSMELTSIVMIKQFVAAGFGASLISPSFAREEVRSGKIRLIPVKDLDVSRELGLVYRKDRSLPKGAVAFIELVRKSFASGGESIQGSNGRHRKVGLTEGGGGSA